MRFPTPSFIFFSVFRPSENRSVESQAIRQALSGCLITLLDLLVFQSFIWLGLHPMAAAVVSFIIVVITYFLVTRYYVFGEVRDQKKSVLFQFLVYLSSALLSLGVIQLFLLVFFVWLGFDPLLVRIAAIPFVFALTFFAGKFLIFQKKAAEDLKAVSKEPPP
jgi:putative flippase GtrA